MRKCQSFAPTLRQSPVCTPITPQTGSFFHAESQVWAYAVVIIKGRNLQKLDRHLAQEAVAEVRTFDPARFQAVSDQTVPFISSIEIITESRKTMMEAEMVLVSDIERRH